MMTDNDRKEIEEMIKKGVLTKEEIQMDIIRPLLMVKNAEQETDRRVIDEKLDRIIEQTTKHNQRMTKIEDKADKANEKINTLEMENVQHVINCPYNDKVRTIEDDLLTQKTTKKTIVSSITLATIVIGALITILKFIQV